MISSSLLQPLVDMLPDLADQPPHPALPRRLNALFAELGQADPMQPPYELEDLIWAIWTDDVPPEQGAPMQQAIRAMATRDFAAARRICDQLVADFPDWSEAWNKRATLFYIMGKDEAALIDIRQTLEREPRHFGALAGLAQICLRHDESDAARLALDAALLVNPHMDAVRAMRDDLPDLPRVRN